MNAHKVIVIDANDWDRELVTGYLRSLSRPVELMDITELGAGGARPEGSRATDPKRIIARRYCAARSNSARPASGDGFDMLFGPGSVARNGSAKIELAEIASDPARCGVDRLSHRCSRRPGCGAATASG